MPNIPFRCLGQILTMPSILQFLNKRTMCILVLAILLLGASDNVSAQEVSVFEAQQFLLENGYSPGVADGIMGRRSRSAVRDFQRDQHIPESGELDAATTAAIHGEATPGFEAVDAEVRGAANYDGISAGTEPPVLHGSSVEVDKLPDIPLSEWRWPMPFVAPLPAPGPADSPPGFEGSGETGIPRVLREEGLPELERKTTRDESRDGMPSADFDPQPENAITSGQSGDTEEKSKDNPSSSVILWVAAALVIWLFWRHRKKQKGQSGADTENRQTNLTTQGGQSDRADASPFKNANAHPVTAYATLSREEKKTLRNDWLAEEKRVVSKPHISPDYKALMPHIHAARAKQGQRAQIKSHRAEKPTMANKPRPEKRWQKSGWVPANECACVAGRDIGGMVYVGVPPRSGRDGGTCGAYIDPSLSVAKIGGDLQGHGMHYWPNYSDISATARATYLDWLQSGRSDLNYNLGYMFLYFYGLERRFFLDDSDSAEKEEILEEVIRLRRVFTENYSAKNYLSRFIEVAELSLNPETTQKPVFSNPGYEFPLSLSVALGEMIAKDEPLTADWALSWLLCHPERHLRIPAHRCEEEFHALFCLKFEERYPEGMKVRRPKKTLQAHYKAASGEFDLGISPTTDGAPLPDISGIRKPLNDAQSIADSAMDDLEKFSRYLGRNPNGRGSLEAQALLPTALWPQFPSAELEELSEWAKNIVARGGLVPVVELVEKLENERPDSNRFYRPAKIYRKQLTGAADALAKLGLGMAPDPRFALRSPSFGDPVVLFTLPEGVIELEVVSDRYRSALLELALGAFIAQADGAVVPEEKEALRHSVHSAKELTQSESVRLEANLTWLLAVPPDMDVFRTKLKNATEEQRNAFTQAVVVMAHADSIIRPEEVGGIEKVYKALGLNPGLVYADIHAAAVTDGPVAVRGVRAGALGEAILDKETSNNGPDLDAARIAAIKTDTARVSSVLGEIFRVEEAQDVDAEPDGNPEEVVSESRFSGLDAKHTVFVAELIGREHWNENEFEELAGRYGLMLSGCLEAINEWAFEKFGDALIEEYDGYELNSDLIHTLQKT